MKSKLQSKLKKYFSRNHQPSMDLKNVHSTVVPLENWSTMGKQAHAIRVVTYLKNGERIDDLNTTATFMCSPGNWGLGNQEQTVCEGMFFVEGNNLNMNVIAPGLESGLFLGSVEIGHLEENGELVLKEGIEAVLANGLTFRIKTHDFNSEIPANDSFLCNY